MHPPTPQYRAPDPQPPAGSSVWRPERGGSDEVAWNDPMARRVARRRLWAGIVALVIAAVGVVAAVLAGTQWWHLESIARWILIAGVGVAAGGIVAAVFAFLAHRHVSAVLKDHPWEMTTVHFDGEQHPRDARLVRPRGLTPMPQNPTSQDAEPEPPDFRADFPGAALERMKGATVRLPIAGEGGRRVVLLDAATERRSRIGLLRPHPEAVKAARAAQAPAETPARADTDRPAVPPGTQE